LRAGRANGRREGRVLQVVVLQFIVLMVLLHVLHGPVRHLVGRHDPGLDVLVVVVGGGRRQLLLDGGQRERVIPEVRGARSGREKRRRTGAQHRDVEPDGVGLRLAEEGASDTVAVVGGGRGCPAHPRAHQAAVPLELGEVDDINLEGD